MKKGARFFLFFLFVVSGAALLLSNEPQLDHVLENPSWQHWAGTDPLGRDLFIRMLQGNFLSWWIGGAAAGLALVVGSVSGAIAGWKKRSWDFVLMRIFEIWNSIPALILVTMFVLLAGLVINPDGPLRIVILAVGIGLTHWIPYARLARALVLQEAQAPYVEGAIAVGASTRQILWTHLRPHVMPTLWRSFWIHLPSCLLFEGLLSFLGFGLQSPQTSLGSLLNEGWKSFSAAPHLLLAPGFLLFATLLGFQIAWRDHAKMTI